jgi:hypothetical protein
LTIRQRHQRRSRTGQRIWRRGRPDAQWRRRRPCGAARRCGGRPQISSARTLGSLAAPAA